MFEGIVTAPTNAGIAPRIALQFSQGAQPAALGDPGEIWKMRAAEVTSEVSQAIVAAAPPSPMTSGTGTGFSYDPARIIGEPVFRLWSFQVLRDGWDGGDAKAPSREMLARAFEFLDAIPPALGQPRPMLSSAGEIAFYWESELGYIEAGFESSGGWYYFSDGIEPPIMDEAQRFDGRLPQQVTDAIKRIRVA